jgi:hypothetical protein
VFRIPTPASQRLVFPSSRLRNHWLPNSGFPTSVSPTSALSSLHSPLNPALLPSSFRTPVLPKSCIPNLCIQCPRLRTTTSETPPPNSRLRTSALSNLRSPLNPARLLPPFFRTPLLPKLCIPNSCIQCPRLRTMTSEPPPPNSRLPTSALQPPLSLEPCSPTPRPPESVLPNPCPSQITYSQLRVCSMPLSPNHHLGTPVSPIPSSLLPTSQPPCSQLSSSQHPPPNPGQVRTSIF